MTELPEAAYVAALLELPGMTPALIATHLGVRRASGLFPPTGPAMTPTDLWRMLARDHRWRASIAGLDVAHLWSAYRREGIAIDVLGTSGYPPELADDPEAPYILFRSGGSLSLEGRRVAIVGTRRATDVGREIAAELGAGLAAAGVRVVSGLALGIDGAAHIGALAARGAPPIGVVAGGIDRPYPSRHRTLWGQVRGAGVLVSEAPIATPSRGWRFPARNRIIAALSEVVVVVESARSGGSMWTAKEAHARSRDVMVVPGSPRNPAAFGTNELLRDGADPVLDVSDVLAKLGMSWTPPATPPAPVVEPRLAPVLRAVDWDATPTDVIVGRLGRDPGAVLAALAILEAQGLVTGGGGVWRRSAQGAS